MGICIPEALKIEIVQSIFQLSHDAAYCAGSGGGHVCMI